ncbi:MAG: hypothetical protein KA010_02300 [Saprospiraceae bacterium]|nr:hypothetical protein [Saprospiraceae bacterium]
MVNELIERIVKNDTYHGLWLNTLSYMENVGARKIKKCEHPIFVTETILKHASEESRHAYYLKKQLKKLNNQSLPSYERQYLLCPKISMYYLHQLDIDVSRYLKRNYNLSQESLRFATYLLVTYAIEVRADSLYPLYQEALDVAKSTISVKNIIAEETQHLREMKYQIAKLFPTENKQVCDDVEHMEHKLFEVWISELEHSIA